MELTIENIGNLAIALSFVVGLIFGIAQVRAAAQDRKERLTLETLRNFQTREFSELMRLIQEPTFASSREEWLALEQEQQVIMMQFAQEMEHLGILVADKYIDLDLVDKTLGSFVTTSWEKYKPMFLDMRAKIPDPYLGEYFQWLAERIAERMERAPRPPYYMQ